MFQEERLTGAKGLKQARAGSTGGSGVLCPHRDICYPVPHHCFKMALWEGQGLSLGMWQGQLLGARGVDGDVRTLSLFKK